MVNNCVVQGCVVGTAKQNVTLREFPKASRQDASCGGGVLEDRLVLRFIAIPAFLKIIPLCDTC